MCACTLHDTVGLGFSCVRGYSIYISITAFNLWRIYLIQASNSKVLLRVCGPLLEMYTRRSVWLLCPRASSARYSLISTVTAPGSARSKQCMSLRRSRFTTQRGIIATSTRAHLRVKDSRTPSIRGTNTPWVRDRISQKSQLNNQQRYPPHHDRTGLHLVHLPSYLSVWSAQPSSK